MTSAAASRSGLRIAGTGTTTVHPAMGPPAQDRSVGNASCVAGHGGTTRATCARQVATIMTHRYAIRPMGSASHARHEEVNMTPRRLFLLSLLPVFSARAFAGKTPAAKDTYLYIIWPLDGARI